MKRLNSILFCAVAAFAVASCNKEAQEVPEAKSDLVPMTFTATTTETRTALDEDHVSIKWLTTDKISVFDGTANRMFTSNGEGTTVQFTGEAADFGNYLAVYPYNENIQFSATRAETTLADAQTPVNGTFADGLNINAALSADKSSFHFENVLSVAKFTLNASNLGGKTIKSVKFASAYPLAGDVNVRISAEEISASAGDNTVNEVTMTSESGLADGTYYFVVLPNAGGEITMTFTAADNSSATKTANLTKAFTAGSIKNLGSVKGLTWADPVWKLVTDASTLSAGDKLVIASNDKGKVASSLSSNYLTEVAATFSTDKKEITSLPADAMQFTLGGTTNAWTLTSNAGQLKSSAAKNVNFTNGTGTWSISISESNDATIQNTTTDYGRILHNVNSTRFTTYASNTSSSMLLPQIYREEPASGVTPVPEQSLTVTPASDNPEIVPATGATLAYTVTVTGIDSWDAVSDNDDFVISKTADGFNVVVAENETSSTKTAKITVSGGSKSYEFTVEQAAGEGQDNPEAQSFIIKQLSIPISGSGYNSYSDISVGGFKFEFVDIMKSGDANIQMKAETGAIFNTSAIGQQIVSISFSTITNSVAVSAGADKDNLSVVTGNGGTYTFADGVKYFKINTGNKYAVIGEITINYIPADGGDQPENPTKTVTFTPGSDTGATSVTKNGITVTMTTMNNDSYYQIYASDSMKVESSSYTIKSISFSCTAEGTNKYGPGNVSASTGEYAYHGNAGSWVGSTREVILSATVQVRMTELIVTYVEN